MMELMGENIIPGEGVEVGKGQEAAVVEEWTWS